MKHMEGGGDRRMIRMKDHSFRRVCLNQICRVERVVDISLLGGGDERRGPTPSVFQG